MPAFGKDGIVNINNNNNVKKIYKIVKPDGTIVMSSDDKSQLESKIETLSNGLNVKLQIVESNLGCI